ncbi:hypothetical protein C8263_17055 [Deinococcus arcticus]|uniref:Uncharacterized protein n=1 Tax=Deinococcus arcticus TaxID=2136176 RepID=A0A2T3W3X8_9DEIO|nr:hypothetical protein C8263_17055 [Deinococcus arcticus]
MTVHASSGDRIGSGAFVPGLRGVMVQVSAWPRLVDGGCWLLVRVPGDARMMPVPVGGRRPSMPARPEPREVFVDQAFG